MKYRIGHGIDAHKLVKNSKFILGGVAIESELGISGHSDGDALMHALTDSILGALSLGDIGTHFPSNDPAWKDKDSKFFLLDALSKINAQNFRINNIDITIILQKPSIKEYANDIKKKLSSLLKIETLDISIKATTTDYLGFVGRQEGIVVHAITLLTDELKNEG